MSHPMCLGEPGAARCWCPRGPVRVAAPWWPDPSRRGAREPHRRSVTSSRAPVSGPASPGRVGPPVREAAPRHAQSAPSRREARADLLRSTAAMALRNMPWRPAAWLEAEAMATAASERACDTTNLTLHLGDACVATAAFGLSYIDSGKGQLRGGWQYIFAALFGVSVFF